MDSDPRMWFVYILECSDGTLYTGYTNDVDARVKKHNAGKGAKYTKSRLPVVACHIESLGSLAPNWFGATCNG